MSAARNIPPMEDTVQIISITYANSTLTVSPQGIIIAPGEQVSFANSGSSQAPIGVTFSANPPGPPAGSTLFTNITNLQPGSTQPQTAPNSNGSVNYMVTAGATSYGPFAIQVGNGPLYIQVTNSNCLPDPAVIPPRGKLAMFSADSGNDSYNVNWTGTNGDPFTPPIQTAVSGMQNNVVSVGTPTLGQYTYKVTRAPIEGNGGGKVIVKGT